MIQRKPQILSSMTTRQKVTALVFVVVVIVIVWQVKELFFPGGMTSTVKPVMTKEEAAKAALMQPMMPTPKPAELQPVAKGAGLTQEELAMLQAQQALQAKYVAALNELQMLKLSREIAETNQAIMASRLAIVTTEKNIVDLLTKPTPPPVPFGTYAQGLITPVPGMVTADAGKTPPPPTTTAVVATPVAAYIVISVSQLQNRWNAVIGFEGKLYSAMIGDILPPDGSKVVNINRGGVLLEKDGAIRKISLVPII